MKVGIDIDGVLTNLERFQIDYGSFYCHQHQIEEELDPKSYQVFKKKPERIMEFWEEYLEKYSLEEPMRPFANDIIQKIKEEDNEIYIITARYRAEEESARGQQMRENVKKWLEKHGIFYDHIIFSRGSKREICKQYNIDCMIEDSPTNVEEISKEIPVFCFDASYNQECIGENIIRCYSWYDIYQKMKKRMG